MSVKSRHSLIMTDISEELRETLRILPEKPGVYRYYDADDKLIYVGKAKNLKRRVNSYFNKEHEGKVYVMVQKIRRLEYIVVNTETDALLLENNLIKQYQPRYNMMLKDDKTYPWLCLSNEDYPRLFSTRRRVEDGSQYFGPYASVKTLNALLEMIHEIYPLRTCRYRLDKSVVEAKKVKLCLEYQMKRCAGPCQGLQTQEEYNEDITQIKSLIKGKISSVLQALHQKMMQAADNLQFKQAHLFKTKIDLLQHYQSKSMVVNTFVGNVDVVGTKEDENNIYFNYLQVVDGLVIQSHTIEGRKKLNENPADLLEQAILEFRQLYRSDASEIILPFVPAFEIKGLRCTVPLAGEKKRLLDLSMKNIDYHILEQSKRMELVDPERRSKEMLLKMQKALGMDRLPLHIECFDNSNFEGDYPVGAMTVSKNGRLSKNDYRHFNIRTVKGANDYATMEEVFSRHYGRMLQEGRPLPQLIIVDGGKGQITSAYKVLSELGIEKDVFLIGIAERLEEIYKVGDPFPLLLDKKSEVLQHIQLLRDEAHRFGITHYRKRHLKGLIKTELTEIKGIGAETASTLLYHFHSVKRVKESSLEELKGCVGEAKANLVWRYFHENQA